MHFALQSIPDQIGKVAADHGFRNVGRSRNDSLAIPGLFAADECTGGVLVNVYVGSGNALASARTFGRVAGRSAAAYAATGEVPPIDWKTVEAAAPAAAGILAYDESAGEITRTSR
jgi:succinate dehydrogenase/fumarate reductase flavoprotein subunit